jgi:mRNA interferase HigB
MVVISRRIILGFVRDYPKAQNPLFRWFMITRRADWSNFSDLKGDFGDADSVGNGLYVFDIGGNKYRLIARIIFRTRTVFIRFVGTHASYDKVKLSEL